MGKYVRYSDEFLDRVRQAADLVGLISRDITLKKSGKNFSACCPFHKEKRRRLVFPQSVISTAAMDVTRRVTLSRG
jgi:hypothetical protein